LQIGDGRRDFGAEHRFSRPWLRLPFREPAIRATTPIVREDRNHLEHGSLVLGTAEDSQMYHPWLALSLNAVQLGIEVQSVIALRMLRFASGGARMEAEATRMVTEKVAAAVEAQTAAAVAAVSGRPQHVVANKALKVFKKRVRANRRRLSRRE
jgi:hypothetical protein